MRRNHFKKLVIGGALLATLGLVAGCGEEGKISAPVEIESADLFESVEASVDLKEHEITLPSAVDSLVVGSLDTLGGAKFFIATDDDPVDPAFDWDEELKEGSVIKFSDTNSVRIVVLDKDNRTIAVWTVSYPVEKSSSSVAGKSSSSSKKDDEEDSSSSEAEPESSSSAEETEESSSSENEAESSSSEITDVSSSSEETVAESSSSSDVISSSSNAVSSSSSSVIPSVVEESSSSSEEVAESSSSVVVETQLPGTSFDSWDKSFWGSTSDAMATEGYGTYNVLIDYKVTMKSSANAIFENSKMTLTTQKITSSAVGINGGWKMAGGFYFAGSYTGTDVASIFQADNSDAGADNRPADFSQYMKFGRPFEGRPVSFDVTYAYVHKDNTNDTYPQSSLIYVALVSTNNKIVAAGKISDNASIDMGKKTVQLKYGSDAGLIAADAVGIKGLALGTGDEEVASIRVMFASSALAYVADGGTSSQMKKNFRGGEGSQLIIDEFKLNY